ncbi:MAG: hypothetical protein L0027_06555 [Candidatus Rokubacteria bacterium]|nr:hypothetical protein [Candidatus Rokubacteria bacterium]
MPTKKTRIPVGSLTDIEPIARQLEPYYLLRQQHRIPFAPLEEVSERELAPPARPSLTPEELREIERGWEAGVGTYAKLMGRSLVGSRRMRGAEIRRGYRRLSPKPSKGR